MAYNPIEWRRPVQEMDVLVQEMDVLVQLKHPHLFYVEEAIEHWQKIMESSSDGIRTYMVNTAMDVTDPGASLSEDNHWFIKYNSRKPDIGMFLVQQPDVIMASQTIQSETEQNSESDQTGRDSDSGLNRIQIEFA